MKRILGISSVLLLSSCESNMVSYLAKQGIEQGSLILKSKRIQDLVKDPSLDPKTERFLKLSVEALAFAQNELGLRVGKNYQDYVDVGRPWVTQSVSAAYTDRLESYYFEYPIFGKLPYRGFFEEPDAIAFEKQLQDQGLDVYRRPVDAYSTTGWLPDPILSTMIRSEARFVELLFHELTHATFYFQGEAEFNEAFASWVGYEGAIRFFEKRNDEISKKALEELQSGYGFQRKFAFLIKEMMQQGKTLYASEKGPEAKKKFMAWTMEKLSTPEFERLKARPWDNNAYLLSLGTYYTLIDPIEGYAKLNQLSIKEYLKWVVLQGPKSIKVVTAK